MSSKHDYIFLFKSLLNLGFSRILIETGLTLLNYFLKNKFINEIFIFKTKFNLKKKGLNFSSNKEIKKIKLKNRLNVNLNEDLIYKEKVK